MKFLKRLTTSKRLYEETKLEPLHFENGVLDYPNDVMNIRVLLVSYYPLDHRQWVDINITGDVSAPLPVIKEHVQKTTHKVIWALETGSIFRGYQKPMAKPSLRYEIVEAIEFLEPLPTWHNPKYTHVPMTDYNAMMNRINVRHWVEERGVTEVWIWGYHGNVVGLWESNMSGPYGDISNSDRDPTDLPRLSKTYTVYHYNYQRGPSEAAEDHMHQIEAVLRHVDPILFWSKFVGKTGEGRCGWSHFPPNGERDYDWANRKSVWTDIEDWQPDGSGQLRLMNCRRWSCDSLTWFIYWMQSIPGRNNGLEYMHHSLTNWWQFIGNFDEAMRQDIKLVEKG